MVENSHFKVGDHKDLVKSSLHLNTFCDVTFELYKIIAIGSVFVCNGGGARGGRPHVIFLHKYLEVLAWHLAMRTKSREKVVCQSNSGAKIILRHVECRRPNKNRQNRRRVWENYHECCSNYLLRLARPLSSVEVVG